ncbi:MAG: energy-coupling factor transporter ATPase [Firmicutes bacterium HGW-Firmicutes-1]|jgi:energy-coupling factor transport system ATP-binding protein|nr:MAG: energy-coupling factor transporter ATPase [Firmicutes bacterium HGW-Firmicutes-1]
MSIEIKELNYVYGKGTPFEKRALSNVSLTIEDGEFIGLIGHTGSGKSTLIQHINRLIKPMSGIIYVDGEDVNGKNINLKKLRQQVGLVFQYPEHQLFEMTVFKDVAFGPTNMGLAKEEIDLRVKTALGKVGLMEEEFYEKSPFELSGGQKRRVAIAGVLAMEPKVLILDEPTAGLDPKGRDDILNEIKKLHKDTKITIILVSHSMEDIARYVDRIIVMDKGSIELDGTSKEVFKNIEKLESMGLGAPQVTYLLRALKEKGMVVEDEAITISEAYEALKELLK